MAARITGISAGSTTITPSYGGQTTSSVTITVVNPGGVTLTNNNAIYKSNNAVVSASNATGTVHYRLGTSGSFSTTIPTATSSYNAGGHTLYYYVDANGSYEAFGSESKPKTMNITIVKATPTMTFYSYEGTLYYNGSKQDIGTITYDGDGTFQYAVTTSNTKPSSGWTTATSGTTIKSSATTVQTYYVWLKASAGTNYTASDPLTYSGTMNIEKGYIYPSVTCSNVACGSTTTATVSSGNPGGGNVTWSSGNTSYATVNSSGTVSGVAVTGSVRITATVEETANYRGGSGYKDIAVTCVAANKGSVNSPSVTFSTSSQTTSLTVTGASGTVTYPTSITVTKGGSAVSGWSCNSSGTLTIPASATAGTYTVSGTISIAASGCYCSGTDNKSWTVTIAKATNQITISPTTKTIYNRSGYNTFYLTVSNHKGTPTASASPSGIVTIGSFDSTNSRFLVTYSSAGSTTITVTDSSTNYATSTATCSVTTKVDTVTNSNYSPSNYTASVSIGSGLTAGGGSATVTASASHTAYNLYESGWYGESHTVTDSVSWSITGNGNSRFSKSGNTLSHSPMGCTATTDTVTVTAVNGSSSSATATDSKSIVNEITNSNYSPSNYTASISITNKGGLTCAGGSSAVSASASHLAYNYYTSGSYCDQHTVSDSVSWSITSNGNSRFSKSGNTLSHNSMGCNATTDTVTVTAVNGSSSSATATDTASMTNSVTNSNYSPSNYTASVSIGDGLSCAGGSATVTASASHLAYDYYCSGDYNNQHTVSDSVSWSITTQTFTPSGGSASNITRFSKSSNTLSHDSMTTNVGTDYVKITAVNGSSSSATATAEKSISNAVTNYDYNSSNSSYNVDVSIGSGLNAGETSTTVSVSGSHTHTYYYLYCSGATSGPYTTTQNDSPSWSITSQYLNSSSNTITRFSKSGNTLSHSSMGTTTGTDYVTITANNNGTTKTASTNVTNSVTNSDYNASNSDYTVSVSIGSGLNAGASSATVSVSGSHTHTYYYLYTSGSTSGPYTSTPSDSPTWSITSQYLNSSSNTITRFSKSSNTLSHATMCETLGTDYVTITATNNTATKTASTNVTNTRWDTNLSSYWASISISNKNGITCAGGSSSVSVSAGHSAKYTYTSGCVSSDTHSVSDGVTWSITSNGNNRFSKSGNTLSHSSMTTNVTTDTVVVTAVNDNSSSATATDTTSVSNTITNSNYNPSGYWSSVSIGNGMTCSGGSATVTASAGHVAYNYYCSGSADSSTHSVSDSVTWSITSNGNNRFSKSGNTLSHDNMTTNGVTDTVTVTAVNGSSSSATSTDTKSITNAITNSNYSPSDYTASVSIGSGLTAAGGSATVTASASHQAYDLYCSGSYNNKHTVNDSVSWTITGNGNNRFSKSGNTLSHSSMGCNATTDTVEVTAVNGSSSSATATDTASIVNAITNSNYSPSDYTVSVSIGSGLTAAGGSATVTATASHKAYNYYTSGSYCGQHDVADTAKWRITSNGNSRFSHPSSGGSTISAGGSNITVYNSGTSVSHSSMGTNVTTDTVTVTAYNTSNTATSSTASKSISNALEGITFTVGSKTISYQGTTKGTVTATYTSGSTKDVENSADTSYTDAANPDIVTFTKTS